MTHSLVDYKSLKPLLSRRVQNFIATPRLFQLDLVVNSQQDIPSIRDYHLLAFHWADDHQRVRLTLEALASVALGANVPSQIIQMFRTCLYECPHPSPVARLTLLIAASLRRLVEFTELLDTITRYNMTAPEWKRLLRFFYPHQLHGEPAYPKEVEHLLKEIAQEHFPQTETDSPNTDPWTRFWILLADWDAENQENFSTCAVRIPLPWREGLGEGEHGAMELLKKNKRNSRSHFHPLLTSPIKEEGLNCTAHSHPLLTSPIKGEELNCTGRKISLENLVHHLRRLRTDYQKYRAGEEIVFRAVRTKNEACLHYLHANALRYMAKRHRKAAIIAVVGIGLAALGEHQQPADLRDQIMACFMEDDEYAPGERFTRSLCDLASTTDERIDALIAVRRMMFPRKPGIQDREAAKGFARIVEKYWDQVGSKGRRRLRWYLAYRQINLDLLPASVSQEPELPAKPTFYRNSSDQNTPRDPLPKTLTSPMGCWINAFIAIRNNDPSQAAELFEMGWQMYHNNRNGDREATYRAAREILQALARQKPSPSLVRLINNFLQQFKMFHGITDNSFCTDALQDLQHEHDRAITRAAELMWQQLRQMPVDEDCTKLSEEMLQASLGNLYCRAKHIRPMKRILLLENKSSRALVKTDVNGFEAQALQAIRPILGDRVPKTLHADRRLLVVEYFEGIPLANLSESDRKICLEKTARALAILHIPVERVPPSSDPGVETFSLARHPPLTVEEIAEELALQNFGDSKRCTATAERLLQDFLKGPFPGDKGLVLIHRDLHHRNVLFCPQDASIQIVDWEDLRLGLPEEDLAFLCSNLPEDQYSWLLEPYCRFASHLEFSPEAFRHYLSRRQAHNTIRRLFWQITNRKEP